MSISISTRIHRIACFFSFSRRVISLNGRDAAFRVQLTIHLPASAMRNRTIVNAQMGTLSVVIDQALYAVLIIANHIVDLVYPSFALQADSSEVVPSPEAFSVGSKPTETAPSSPETALSSPKTLLTSFSSSSKDHPQSIGSSEELQSDRSFSIKRDMEVHVACDAFEFRINSLPVSKDLQSRFHRDEFNQLFYIFAHGVAFQMTKKEKEEVSLSIESAGIQFDQGNDAYIFLQHLGEARESLSDSNQFISVKMNSGITNVTVSSCGLDIRPILLLHYTNFILSVFDEMPLEHLSTISPKQKAVKPSSSVANDVYLHIRNPSIRLLINNKTEEAIMGSMREFQFIISSSAFNPIVSELKLSIASAESEELTICQDFTGAVKMSHASDHSMDLNVTKCEVRLYPRLLKVAESLLEMVSVTKSGR